MQTDKVKWNLAKLVRIKVKMVLMIVKLNSWEVLFLTVLKQNRKKETTLTYKTFNSKRKTIICLFIKKNYNFIL